MKESLAGCDDDATFGFVVFETRRAVNLDFPEQEPHGKHASSLTLLVTKLETLKVK